MFWYWWIWWAAILVLIVWLVSAWAYRGWGPPYPGDAYRRYYRRQPGPRGQPVVVPTESPPPPPRRRAWGMLADLFWLAVVAAAIWAIVWWFV